MCELLRDPNALVRECAIRVAGYFGFDNCVPAIFDALSDASEDVAPRRDRAVARAG
jgi:hypothetical protein